MSKILIVEDNKSLSKSISYSLEFNKYQVDVVDNGKDAVSYLDTFSYDAIILDWELPDMSGVEILKNFRAGNGNTPVLMLTGKGRISEKEMGFGAGADDYLTKPFEMQELLMRLVALLRRPAEFKGTLLKVRNYEIDTIRHKFFRDGVAISLQPMEFALLEFLMKHPDHVFTIEALISRCWNDSSEIAIATVYSCIRRLRQKIDVEGQVSLIATVHGVGYRLNSSE